MPYVHGPYVPTIPWDASLGYRMPNANQSHTHADAGTAMDQEPQQVPQLQFERQVSWKKEFVQRHEEFAPAGMDIKDSYGAPDRILLVIKHHLLAQTIRMPLLLAI